MAKNFGQTGRHYRYEPTDKKGKGALEFWAENGMICMLDERLPTGHPDHFLVLTIREFLVNLRGINMSIERCAYATGRTSMALNSAKPGGAAAEEREELHRLVANGIACAKEAKNHGDPTNPRHMADMMKARRRTMVQSGVPSREVKDGAVSADIAPEAAVLPPLILPGIDHQKPKKKLIV